MKQWTTNKTASQNITFLLSQKCALQNNSSPCPLKWPGPPCYFSYDLFTAAPSHKTTLLYGFCCSRGNNVHAIKYDECTLLLFMAHRATCSPSSRKNHPLWSCLQVHCWFAFLHERSRSRPRWIALSSPTLPLPLYANLSLWQMCTRGKQSIT